MKILIVEDEAPLRETMAARLSREGLLVETAADGEEGLRKLRLGEYSAAIVDLGLPHMSGGELIEAARAEGKTLPVLILTARASWEDKVKGLRTGADDYLVKPFHVEELLARIQAMVRRSAGWARPVLECPPYSLDLSAQRLTRDGEEISLTNYEYKVLEHLMMHAGSLVSKTELSEHLYHEEADRESNVLEVFVGRLRKKLDPDGTIHPIETVRGRGYRFVLERSTEQAQAA